MAVLAATIFRNNWAAHVASHRRYTRTYVLLSRGPRGAWANQ